MDQQNHQYYLEPFLIKELIFLKLIRLTDYKIQWIKNNKKWMIFLTCGIWIESGFLCGECMNLPCYCNTKFYWTCKESFKWTFPTLIWFKLFFMTVVIAHCFEDICYSCCHMSLNSCCYNIPELRQTEE